MTMIQYIQAHRRGQDELKFKPNVKMEKQVDLTDFDDCMVVGADLDFLHNQKRENSHSAAVPWANFKKAPLMPDRIRCHSCQLRTGH